MNFVKYIPTPTYKQVTDKTRINISLYYYVKNEINRVFANAIASHEKDWRCLEFNNFIGDFLIGEIKYWEDVYYPIAKTSKKKQTYLKEQTHFRLWINPVFGSKSLRDIKPIDIERLKKKLLDADRTPDKYHTEPLNLSVVLNAAPL